MLVALEGIDGSGTTTQAREVAGRLKALGHAVTVTAQPSTGALGVHARTLLQETADASTHRAQLLALTFAADRLDHYDRCIAPALRRGDIVICDRYVLSSWAYQSLDLPLAWVQAINRFAPWPDLTILLDLDPKLAHARVQARQGQAELYDRLDLQTRLATHYREFMKTDTSGTMLRVGAEASISDLCETLVERVLAQRERGPDPDSNPQAP